MSSEPVILTGVPVQIEGLGPDAPALPVSMGELSRSTGDPARGNRLLFVSVN